MFRKPGMAHRNDPDEEEMYIDIVVYGNASKAARANYRPIGTVWALGAFTLDKGGFQGT